MNEVLDKFKRHKQPCGTKAIHWLCQCDCGSEPKFIAGNCLRSGQTSCSISYIYNHRIKK